MYKYDVGGIIPCYTNPSYKMNFPNKGNNSTPKHAAFLVPFIYLKKQLNSAHPKYAKFGCCYSLCTRQFICYFWYFKTHSKLYLFVPPTNADYLILLRVVRSMRRDDVSDSSMKGEP